MAVRCCECGALARIYRENGRFYGVCRNPDHAGFGVEDDETYDEEYD